MRHNSTVVVIPARMGSSRFPGKPLEMVFRKPMLHWVIQNSIAAVGRDHTFVASCDDEILEYAGLHGVTGVMTSGNHERASDRTHEAVESLLNDGRHIENVLMLQGDEPTIPPQDIVKAIEALESSKSEEIVNLMGEITSREEWEDPNTIKVVVGANLSALYFSRSPIPHGSQSFKRGVFKQVCAIGFSLRGLREFSALAPDPLEIAESIDMLRWLSSGRSVRMVYTDAMTQPVDVPSDIPKVEKILALQGNEG